MESDAGAGAPSGRVKTPGFDRSAAITRSLLGYGVLVGPLYLVVGLTQAFVREGFDLRRHALSLLANGPGGWVQTANFVLSGLMVIAAAVGFARVPLPRPRAASVLLGCYGVCLLGAAAFRADPMDGFPVGTAPGYPAAPSATGLLHFVAAATGFLMLALACFAMAVTMRRWRALRMAVFSLGCGLAIIIGFAVPMVLPLPIGPVAGIWFTVVAGWAWLALTSVHLYRTVPHPDGPAATG